MNFDFSNKHSWYVGIVKAWMLRENFHVMVQCQQLLDKLGKPRRATKKKEIMSVHLLLAFMSFIHAHRGSRYKSNQKDDGILINLAWLKVIPQHHAIELSVWYPFLHYWRVPQAKTCAFAFVWKSCEHLAVKVEVKHEKMSCCGRFWLRQDMERFSVWSSLLSELCTFNI